MSLDHLKAAVPDTQPDTPPDEPCGSLPSGPPPVQPSIPPSAYSLLPHVRTTRRPKRPSSNFGPKSYSILATFKTEFEARRKYVTVIINDKPVRLQLDMASGITLISKRTWHMVGRPPMITLNEKALNVSGDQYDLYRQDRIIKRGGGCILYFKASFKHFPFDLVATSFSGCSGESTHTGSLNPLSPSPSPYSPGCSGESTHTRSPVLIPRAIPSRLLGRPRLADRKIRGRKTQTNNNTLRPNPPRHTLQAVRVSPLTLAAWNVRSVLDNPRSNRMVRRTALVARELARCKVDIAALSETRFPEQGQLDEVGAVHTFFWSGRRKAE
ncbi:unnamed protein product [Schistocephalus solidus]|uniref:Endo/exonuclease/phosphatase domain-containing protein n=1 Tax=Schistocephalus solidus TaxID=70667 RepID=A0A183SMF2_SCHSO|nr:unnamed protein product [Schistocephalus solidus]